MECCCAVVQCGCNCNQLVLARGYSMRRFVGRLVCCWVGDWGFAVPVRWGEGCLRRCCGYPFARLLKWSLRPHLEHISPLPGIASIDVVPAGLHTSDRCQVVCEASCNSV